MELFLALGGLALLLALNVAMFISLGRQGDERRRIIVEKSAAGTFAATAVYLLFCIGEGDIPLGGPWASHGGEEPLHLPHRHGHRRQYLCLPL